MQADDIALGQQSLQPLDRLGVAVAKPVGVAIEHQLHAHGFRQSGNQTQELDRHGWRGLLAGQ